MSKGKKESKVKTDPAFAESAEKPSAHFVEVDSASLPSTDIVFECPLCGKSLAIDCKGAGLVISCTSCHELITVPIPDGMDISDLDTQDGEKEVQILNLRRGLAKSDARIAELEERVSGLEAENAVLKEFRNAHAGEDGGAAARVSELRDICGSVFKTQAELAGVLDRLQKLVISEE